MSSFKNFSSDELGISRKRLSGGLLNYVIFLYAPIGLLLLVLRLFVSFHAFVISCLLLPFPAVRKAVLRFFCVICGVVIVGKDSHAKKHSKTETSKDGAEIFVCNSITRLDPFVVDFFIPCITYKPDVRLPFPMQICLKWTNFNVPYPHLVNEDVLIDKAKKFCKNSSQPVLFFPEDGKHGCFHSLCKFSKLAFALSDEISLIGLYVCRPLVFNYIATSTVNSSAFCDVMWTFFVPFTVYDVRHLPPYPLCRSSDSIDEYANRASISIAQALNLTTTEFSFSDLLAKEKEALQKSKIHKLSAGDDSFAKVIKCILPTISISAINEEAANETSIDVVLLKILKKNFTARISSIGSQKMNSSADFRSFNEHFQNRKVELITENLLKYLRRTVE